MIDPIIRTFEQWYRGQRHLPLTPPNSWSVLLSTLAAAVMSFLAVMTLSAGLAANELASAWRQDLSATATLRLSTPPEEMEASLRAASEVLRTTPGIADIRVLSKEESQALLVPWLGDGVALDDLPIPRLIDIALEGAGPDREALQARLNLTVPGAIYDDHARWRTPLAHATRMLERVAWLATALVCLAAGLMVALAARVTLAGNRDTVGLLRLIGGEDRMIARAFVGALAWRAWAGAMGGTLIGIGVLRLFPKGEAGSVFENIGPGFWGGIILLISVPVAATIIAWATAHFTMRLALAKIG